MRFLAKGKRSIVYLTKYQGRKAVIKIETRNLNVLKNEYEILKIVNKYKIGPKLLDYKQDRLILKYVFGTPLLRYIETSPSSSTKRVLKEILLQCRILDKLNINKYELANPYKDIIVDKNPVMIDFERARFTEKPKNVTQFCQFLLTKPVQSKLKKKNSRDSIILLLKDYKNKQTDKNFKKIVDTLL